jgi:hypothetical protein
MMRRAAAVALCVAVGGCGGGGGEEPAPAPAARSGTPSPAEAASPQPLAYTAGARAALAGGAVGVVDLSNRAGVEPRSMDVNREQQLSRLRWSGWGGARATGRGDVSTLVCDPSCATGRRETSRAVIVLSSPRRCGASRFYTRSTMTYEDPGTRHTRAPDTYLRTPPC